MRYRFVDCRWDLFDPDAGRRAYVAAHIPGAAFLDVETELASAPSREGRHPLPEPAVFAAAAGRAGIDRDTHVVAYGSPGAERLWWLLRHFGHDDCSVLVGGIEAWGGALRGGVEEVEAAVFVAGERTGRHRSRRRDRFAARGCQRSCSSTRAWHRASAASRTRSMSSPAVSRRRATRPGTSRSRRCPDGEVIAYCGSGVTACVILHRLWLAGRAGRLYPDRGANGSSVPSCRASGGES